jgi:hypothetical protein
VERDGVEPASISRRRVGKKIRFYAIMRNGEQRYIGTAGDPAAEAAAAAYRAAAARARSRRKTITMLKAAGVSAPDVLVGRVVEAFAQAGLFDRGAVLIGTAAFQLYPLVVGAYLPSASWATQDADLALARLAIRNMAEAPAMEQVLAAVDPTFAVRLSRDDRHACTFVATSGFIVDVLTTPGRSGDEPILVRGLNCGAQPLKYLDYLIEDPIWAAGLIGSGIPVLVPQPQRYALHKLIVAQKRPNLSAKAPKGIAQARALIAALDQRDPRLVPDAIADLRARGPTWRKLLREGLDLLARTG